MTVIAMSFESEYSEVRFLETERIVGNN